MKSTGSQKVVRKHLDRRSKLVPICFQETCNGVHTESQVQWAEGFILVYSVTDHRSFELIRDLKQVVDDVKAPRVPYCCLVVGNKNDLEAGRQVTNLCFWEFGYSILTSTKLTP